MQDGEGALASWEEATERNVGDWEDVQAASAHTGSTGNSPTRLPHFVLGKLFQERPHTWAPSSSKQSEGNVHMALRAELKN